MAARRKKKGAKGSTSALVTVADFGSNLPANLAAYAKLAETQEYAVEETAARTISTRNGMFSLGDDEQLGNSIDVIILGSIHMNVYYEGKFDPNVRRGARCFALGHDRDEMAPPSDFAAAISKSCGSCAYHEWGSNDRGSGRACKEAERLLVALASDVVGTDQQLSDVLTYNVSISVTSAKIWRDYHKMLVKTTKLPTYAVVTEMTLAPHAKNQFECTFKPLSVFDIKVVNDMVVPWVDSKHEDLFAPPNLSTGEAEEQEEPATTPVPRRTKAPVRSKTAAKKRGARKAPAKTGRASARK